MNGKQSDTAGDVADTDNTPQTFTAITTTERLQRSRFGTFANPNRRYATATSDQFGNGRRLVSRREVAAYMGVCVKTVQRYEDTLPDFPKPVMINGHGKHHPELIERFLERRRAIADHETAKAAKHHPGVEAMNKVKKARANKRKASTEPETEMRRS
jgi:predicted DNA-binding transcriptional regulator AlpA